MYWSPVLVSVVVVPLDELLTSMFVPVTVWSMSPTLVVGFYELDVLLPHR